MEYLFGLLLLAVGAFGCALCEIDRQKQLRRSVQTTARLNVKDAYTMGQRRLVAEEGSLS